MIDYADLAVTATELIKEFGTQMILRSNSVEDSYDPIEGEVTLGAGDAAPAEFVPNTEWPTDGDSSLRFSFVAGR